MLTDFTTDEKRVAELLAECFNDENGDPVSSGGSSSMSSNMTAIKYARTTKEPGLDCDALRTVLRDWLKLDTHILSDIIKHQDINSTTSSAEITALHKKILAVLIDMQWESDVEEALFAQRVYEWERTGWLCCLCTNGLSVCYTKRKIRLENLRMREYVQSFPDRLSKRLLDWASCGAQLRDKKVKNAEWKAKFKAKSEECKADAKARDDLRLVSTIGKSPSPSSSSSSPSPSLSPMHSPTLNSAENMTAQMER